MTIKPSEQRTRIKRVGIPAELHRWLKIRAATEGMTIEEVVVWLINEARARIEG